jgi:putative FmdB family regulatory protein
LVTILDGVGDPSYNFVREEGVLTMPKYEYFCRTCNTRYEKIRPMTEADAPIDCPNCEEQNSSTPHSSADYSSSSAMSSGGCGCGGACACGGHSSLN